MTNPPAKLWPQPIASGEVAQNRREALGGGNTLQARQLVSRNFCGHVKALAGGGTARNLGCSSLTIKLL